MSILGSRLFVLLIVVFLLVFTWLMFFNNAINKEPVENPLITPISVPERLGD